MTKNEVVDIMLNSFISVNRELAEQSGMEEEEISKFIESSKGSIEYMLNAVYDTLLEKNIIKQD